MIHTRVSPCPYTRTITQAKPSRFFDLEVKTLRIIERSIPPASYNTFERDQVFQEVTNHFQNLQINKIQQGLN